MKKITATCLVLLLLACTVTGCSACTAFCICREGKIFLCKNFDYHEVDGLLYYSPPGEVHEGPVHGLSWVSKYGSISFCYEKPACPLGGMNEKGLCIEELSCQPFASVSDSNRTSIDEFGWVRYHLDRCATVGEVIASQDTLSLVPGKFHLHYIITDATGRVAVIRFEAGRAVIFAGDSLPYPVLSNNTYESSLRYLTFFQGFGGDLPVNESLASCDRFVRITRCLTGGEASGTVDERSCFAMLDEVRQEDTQWQLVYDIPERKVYFIADGSTVRHVIDLEGFMHSGDGKPWSISLENLYGC
jgi:choloylglycine hydrolase